MLLLVTLVDVFRQCTAGYCCYFSTLYTFHWIKFLFYEYGGVNKGVEKCSNTLGPLS